MDLCNVSNLRKILKEQGLWAKKTLGQHFLVNREILKFIIKAAELKKDDYVIEVGAGLGTLSLEILETGAKLLAVEKDTEIIDVLKKNTKGFENIEIIEADILKMSNQDLGIVPNLKYKVVANLPYYITSPVLQYFLEKEEKPQELVLMVQREVAKRITAGPGDLSILAISVQIYGKPEIVCEASRSNFFPEPQVDSTVIKITPYGKLFFDIKDKKLFFQIVKAGFGERRKQLHNSLAGGLNLPESEIKKMLDAANVNPTWRAENLSILDWKKIYDYISLEKSL
ncbi:16S rRNA (adenine(1518)-N(6)/adenine(1519)-N(6))-dimethyltransferase RsmA [Patescibacteria group bacterium]